MTQAPLEKITARWHSSRLQREVTTCRWGSFGQPVLIFPTAGGDAEEIERMHLITVLRPLIEAGQIKVYATDSVAGMGLVRQEGSPQHRMWLQNQFHQFIRHEVVPAIYADCGGEPLPIWTAGASFGAFHAVAVTCRFPDVFERACAMSGTYDLRRFFGVEPSQMATAFTQAFWVSSPLHFLGALPEAHLEVLRRRFILMPSGEGKAEDIGESFAMARVLGRAKVPNRVDNWGPKWPHDWDTWRTMLPQYLSDWLKPQG